MNLHENRELFTDAILAASQAKEDGPRPMDWGQDFQRI